MMAIKIVLTSPAGTGRMQQNYHPGIDIGLVIRSHEINHRHGQGMNTTNHRLSLHMKKRVKVTVKKRD
jgi:hypothetical protein